MSVAYVDTSCLVAIAFDEPGSSDLATFLERFDELFSANLMEAELRATLAREAVATDTELLSRISWVLPDRPLSREISQALGAGYLRGADLWHVASALFLAPSSREIDFVTIDRRQRDVARRLGFAVR